MVGVKKATYISLLFGLFAFFIDRGQKFYQINMQGWSGGEVVSMTSFLDYVLVWNPGISFGLFGSAPSWVLPSIIGIAIVALGFWWVKETDLLSKIGLALCIGGALSNIIDRFLYGAVADFFHIYWGQKSIFVNNIADMIIFVGVLLLLPNMLQSTSKKS